MSNSRYKSRYTACGRSFNKLRNDAKSLKKKQWIKIASILG